MSTIPDVMKLAIAALVVGGAAEMIYTVSPGAAYGLVLLALFGYMAAGGRLPQVSAFIKTATAVSTPKG